MATTMPSPTTRRFTVREYEQMIATGVIREGERVELLEGEIIEMAAMGLPHVKRIVAFDYLLKRRVPATYIVAVQIPILLDDESQPEPDIVVYEERNWQTLPTPDGILLVVEIADSSLAYDRDRKLPRYAAAGIPEVWIDDVLPDILERHTKRLEGH